LKQLRKLLGDNLRIVFRHFPTVQTHPHSLRAAEASEAAGAQERFWQMHDELFTHQTALEDRHLSRYARRIGLGEERFAHDMKANTFLEQIEADYQRSLFNEHVTGTPTIYLNSIRYTGAMDLEASCLQSNWLIPRSDSVPESVPRVAERAEPAAARCQSLIEMYSPKVLTVCAFAKVRNLMKKSMRVLLNAAAILFLSLTSATIVRPQARPAIQDRFASVGGVRLHYLIAGKGDR